MKIHILLFVLQIPTDFPYSFFQNQNRKREGGNPAMGEDLLYSRLSPRGKSYYIASFPGGKATMGEKLLYNTASHEYKIRSSNKGAQMVLMGIPTDCWETCPPTTTKILSMRNSSIFSISTLE
jgi:hypothetical protein